MWILGFGLLTADAYAANRDVVMCVAANVQFVDVGGGEDRWPDADDATEPGRGFEVRLFDDTTNAFVWPDALGSWGATDDENAAAGCTPTLSLVVGHEYDLYVHSVAQVDGHEIRSYDGTPSAAFEEVIPDYVVPAGATALTETGYVEGSTDGRWNYLAAAAFAIKMHDGKSTDQTLTIKNDGGCGGATNGSTVSLGSNCKEKFVLAHEIGHAVANWSDPGAGTNTTALGAGNCDGAPYIKMEYAKTSFVEGIADVYSAFTWNELVADDCVWARPQEADWDLNGDDDYLGYAAELALGHDFAPCVGDPIDGTTPDPDDRDWLKDLVDGDDDNDDGLQCTATLTNNRLTEFDFDRYAWEMLTEEGMEIADFYEVWDDGDMQTTDSDDNVIGSNGLLSTSDDPTVRWEAACDSNGFGNAHDDRKNHGLCHGC